MRRCVLICGILLATLLFLHGGVALVGDPAPEDALERFFAAEGEQQVLAAIDAIVASGATVEEVASRLREGRSYAAELPRGWQVYELVSSDGVTRPFHLFVPEDYDPAERVPLLFDLHGAVMGPGFTVAELAPRRALWETAASAAGFLVIMPHGDEQAPWWSELGRGNLLAELALAKRLYNVDEDRVFLSGFSDGGSGAFWMALHDPTPWAGFISLYGNPTVAAYGDYRCYPRNLLNRPIRAANGAYDAIYPASELRLIYDQMLLLGVGLEWSVYGTGHDLSFFADEEAQSEAFIERVVRRPLFERVIWETDDSAVGRCDWVRIDRVADVGNNAPFDNVNLWYPPGSGDFGAAIGAQGGEEGFRVAGVVPGTVAHLAGIRSGDLIVSIDGRTVRSSFDLQAVMATTQPGQLLSIEIRRDGAPLTLSGTVPGLDPIYTQRDLVGTIDVAVDGNRIDVAVRNVAAYTLFLSSEMFELERPLVVTTNGAVTFDGVVETDLRFMLERAAVDNDRSTVYEAGLQILVPPM